MNALSIARAFGSHKLSELEVGKKACSHVNDFLPMNHQLNVDVATGHDLEKVIIALDHDDNEEMMATSISSDYTRRRIRCALDGVPYTPEDDDDDDRFKYAQMFIVIVLTMITVLVVLYSKRTIISTGTLLGVGSIFTVAKVLFSITSKKDS